MILALVAAFIVATSVFVLTRRRHHGGITGLGLVAYATLHPLLLA